MGKTQGQRSTGVHVHLQFKLATDPELVALVNAAVADPKQAVTTTAKFYEFKSLFFDKGTGPFVDPKGLVLNAWRKYNRLQKHRLVAQHAPPTAVSEKAEH